MSRITKEIAASVAVKLVAKKAKLRDETNNALKKELTEMVKKTIPKEVFDFHLKFPNYIDTRSNLQLQGNGWNYEYLNLSESLPLRNNYFIPSKDQAKVLRSLYDEYKEHEKDTSNLRRKIENLLYSLRTYNRVNAEFPEATPFLPSIKETGLSINISDIRNEL